MPGVAKTVMNAPANLAAGVVDAVKYSFGGRPDGQVQAQNWAGLQTGGSNGYPQHGGYTSQPVYYR